MKPYGEKYYIVHSKKTGKAIGLDVPSGGYPYETEYPSQVKWWATREAAEKYISSWPEDYYITETVILATEFVEALQRGEYPATL